jgi:hypothetical protein
MSNYSADIFGCKSPLRDVPETEIPFEKILVSFERVDPKDEI